MSYSEQDAKADFYNDVNHAIKTKNAPMLYFLAEQRAEADDMEEATRLRRFAIEIESDGDWAYDRHVDNQLCE